MGCHALLQGISWPRDWTRVSCLGRWILYHWTTWEAPVLCWKQYLFPSACGGYVFASIRALICFNFSLGCMPWSQISLWTSDCGPCLMVTFPGSQIAFFIALEGYKFFVIPSWVLTSHLKVKSSVSHYCFLGLSSIASDQHVINVLRLCSSFSVVLIWGLQFGLTSQWILENLLLHLCVHAEQADSSK